MICASRKIKNFRLLDQEFPSLKFPSLRRYAKYKASDSMQMLQMVEYGIYPHMAVIITTNPKPHPKTSNHLLNTQA